MRIANLRAGAYALLATSLINAVYQGGGADVWAKALVSACVAALLLLATTTASGRAALSRPAAIAVVWAVIAVGLALNLLG